MGTRERLDAETDKWRGKLEGRLEKVEADSSEAEKLIENARAYLRDSEHFEEEGDLVRAFEAVVWGWAWLEIGEELGVLDSS